ncbi:MAG: propanediol utilization microcompartment protein PduB [Lachnospiraceae bacterium]
MKQQMIEKVMEEVSRELGVKPPVAASNAAPTKLDASRPVPQKSEVAHSKCEASHPEQQNNDVHPPVTEFVGTAAGDTIGLLIAGVDPQLKGVIDLGRFRSLGIIGSRMGADPQIMAADEAIKSTNSEIISVEYPRDTRCGAGRGSLIYIGAEDVSDARRAVEIALANTEKYFGDVYRNQAGHLEFQYTARASYCLEKAYGAPLGKAFGLVTGAPAAIGTVLADVAVKAANIEIVEYRSPARKNSNSNEVVLAFSGDSGAVRQAVQAARDTGKKILGALGEEPVSGYTPYI